MSAGLLEASFQCSVAARTVREAAAVHAAARNTARIFCLACIGNPPDTNFVFFGVHRKNIANCSKIQVQLLTYYTIIPAFY